MLGSKEPLTLIPFGPFEADLSTQELRKQGVRLRLPRQSFQILKMLLERPGELVTREHLRAALWPVDTFVDFEHGLNAAINRLREALGDDADNPVYIETLPRRGYRFIATINYENAIDTARTNPKQLAKDSASGETASVEVVEGGISHKFVWLGVLAASIVVVAIVGLFVWRRLAQAPPKVTATTQLTSDGLQKSGLLTDGSRLYFLEAKEANYFLVQAPVAGGESSPVPASFPTFPGIMDISPDHSQLLVQYLGNEGANFWSLQLPTGPARRIADVSGYGGKWSPDGRQLLFSSGDNVYLAKADGTEARKLFTMIGGATWPQFSPDSNRIRFSTWNEKDTSVSIWEIRTDGRNLHPLLPGWRNPPSECCGVWSPDGRYFFFLNKAGLGATGYRVRGGNIWALKESNSAFRKYSSRLFQLTVGPMLFVAMALSPDGKKLFAEGRQSHGELVRYDAQQRAYVPFLSGIWATDVNFSRDGKWVAYVSYPDRTLWRSRVDGSERLQLTNPPVFVFMPRWSPDGAQIAFTDIQTGRPWKIWLVSAKGGVAHELLTEDLRQVDPEWSPDGKQMAFGRFMGVEDSTIQLVDLASKRVSIIPGSQGLFSPRWSPDGRYLAALTFNGAKIVIFDFRTQKWSDWFGIPGVLGYPAWSRDGEFLYFEKFEARASGYYRIRLGQTRPELVVDLKGVREFIGPGGIWRGITPDGSPLIVRDTSTDEIYALDLDLP